MQEHSSKNDKKLASVCGLYCGACSAYIATTEDPSRLKKHAKEFNYTEEEMICYGCRSDNTAKFCNDCKFKSCASNYGVEFCNECPEFPCNDFKEFQAELPHRNEIWDDLNRINEIGWSKWMDEVKQHYSCSKCQTINPAYDLKCRKCGNKPSSNFATRNKKDIKKFLKRG